MFNHYNTLTARKYRVHDLSLGPDRPTYEYRMIIKVDFTADRESNIEQVAVILNHRGWEHADIVELMNYLRGARSHADFLARLDEYVKHN